MADRPAPRGPYNTGTGPDPRRLLTAVESRVVHVFTPGLERSLCGGVIAPTPTAVREPGAGERNCLICRDHAQKPACTVCWRSVPVRTDRSASVHPGHQTNGHCPGVGKVTHIPRPPRVPAQEQRLRAGGPGWGSRSLDEIGGLPETHVDLVIVEQLLNILRTPTRTPTRAERLAAARILEERGKLTNEAAVAIGVPWTEIAAMRKEPARV